MSYKHSTESGYIALILCILLYFVPKYLEYTTFAYFDTVTSLIQITKTGSYVLAAALFCLKIIRKNRIPISYFLIIIPALIYYIYQFSMKGHNTIFVLMLFSLIYEEKYFDRYISLLLRLSCILYCVTVISSDTGIIENVYTSRNKFGSIWIAGGNGFEYPGQMMMSLIPIVLMFYYKYDKKIKWYHNIIWIGISTLVYARCRTIAGFMLIVAFIVLHGILSKCQGKLTRFLHSKFVMFSPFIFAGVTIFMIWVYDKGSALGYFLDTLLNGRLSVVSRIIQRYGIHLLGSDFVNNTLDGKYEIIDSEYMSMLIAGGVIYLLIGLMLCVFIIRYTQKRNETMTLIWFMIFLNAVVNNGIFGLVMNPFSIIIVPALRDLLRKRNRREVRPIHIKI